MDMIDDDMMTLPQGQKPYATCTPFRLTSCRGPSPLLSFSTRSFFFLLSQFSTSELRIKMFVSNFFSFFFFFGNLLYTDDQNDEGIPVLADTSPLIWLPGDSSGIHKMQPARNWLKSLINYRSKLTVI